MHCRNDSKGRIAGRGADLRIYTEFRHNEHIDITSNNPEIIVVESVADKIDRTPPLLWNKWEYARVEKIPHSDIKACL